MTVSENPVSIPDYISKPAFCVRDHIIISVNQSASNRMLETGADIRPYLASGAEDYAEFRSGILYLTVMLGDTAVDATVTDTEDALLFVLEDPEESPELRALSLAAMQLRAPMTGLMLSMEKLNIGDNAEAAEQLAKMNRSLHQMLRMIGNMSDTARYASSKVSRLELQDARAVFAELFQKISVLTASAGMTVEFQNLPDSLFCLLDTEKLERAIYNLLSNALKFTPGNGRIRVLAAASGKRISLTVENTADSRSPRQNVDLFHRYTREPSLEDVRCGIGLGMSIVRIAAAVHDGTVLMTQNGSTTTVRLNLAVKKPGTDRIASRIMRIDYAGERDHGLIELSDVLPIDQY